MKQLIFVVEDEEAIRELYAYTATNAGFDVTCFSCGDNLFQALTETKPDLFILDIMLDGMNGYEILEKLKGERTLADIPVIMVSAKGEEMSKVKGLNLGADDYISKPFGVLELIARINAALRKSSKNTKKTAFKDILIDDNTHSITVGKSQLALSPKEYLLLRFFVENAENALTREEILNKVWGEDFFCETRTLDMHVTSLRKKLLGKESTAEIVTVRGVGFKLI